MRGCRCKCFYIALYVLPHKTPISCANLQILIYSGAGKWTTAVFETAHFLPPPCTKNEVVLLTVVSMHSDFYFNLYNATI
jgi:hypothetical protein